MIAAGLIVACDECPPERGARAEDLEVRGGDMKRADEDWLRAGAEDRGSATHGRRSDLFEDRTLRVVEGVEGRHRIAAARRRPLPKAHETVGVRVGQRRQQETVDETENGGVGANAKGE